ncbi:MAG: DMT family transporter [Clostridiales bacterium]|nr:DMT family transporter [Clostridiales bacterium]
MKNKELRYAFLLLLTSAIWGFAMAAQRDGSQYIPPFTFLSIRYFLGGMALLPLMLRESKKNGQPMRKKEALIGVLIGVVLFIASLLQQLGVRETGAGKAAFLTALYVVLVPVLGIFMKKKTQLTTWLALLLAIPSLYLLCVPEGEAFTLAPADGFLLLGAVFWALHILFTDQYASHVSALKLCTVQFFVVSILNAVPALLFESVTLDHLLRGLWAVVYCGLFSTAMGYTFQTIGQKHCRPAYAALILSLESVFGVISGALLLGERMALRGYIGCVFMMVAVVLAQAGALIKPKKENAHV